MFVCVSWLSVSVCAIINEWTNISQSTTSALTHSQAHTRTDTANQISTSLLGQIKNTSSEIATLVLEKTYFLKIKPNIQEVQLGQGQTNTRRHWALHLYLLSNKSMTSSYHCVITTILTHIHTQIRTISCGDSSLTGPLLRWCSCSIGSYLGLWFIIG